MKEQEKNEHIDNNKKSKRILSDMDKFLINEGLLEYYEEEEKEEKDNDNL